MELSIVEHIETEKLPDINADLFVCAPNQEPRCKHIASLLENKNCRKIALVSSTQETSINYRNNLAYFRDHGFEILAMDSAIPDMGKILEGFQGPELNIIFDCTSMSPRWYYEFLRWFDESQDDFISVRLRFTYTLAGYVHEGSSKKVRRVKEFLKRESRKKKSKTALILGLGHESNVSETIHRIEKPDLLYLYYTDPPVDKRFVEQVFVNNHKLIQQTPIRNLIAYPVSNGQTIYQNLINTILPIRSEYSITLIPLGPKIFSVAAMLVHLGYPDIRISYPMFKNSPVHERDPYGKPVVLDVYFQGED